MGGASRLVTEGQRAGRRAADGWQGQRADSRIVCRPRTDRRDRPCDLVTRRRVMVYCHPGVEQPDDEPPELDDHQRTAGRNASQTMELLKRREQHSHGGELRRSSAASAAGVQDTASCAARWPRPLE